MTDRTPIELWISPEGHVPPCIRVAKTKQSPKLECYITMRYASSGDRTYVYTTPACRPEDKITKEDLDFDTRCKELGNDLKSRWRTDGIHRIYLQHFPQPEATNTTLKRNEMRRKRAKDCPPFGEHQKKKQKMNPVEAEPHTPTPTAQSRTDIIAAFDDPARTFGRSDAEATAYHIRDFLKKKSAPTIDEVLEMRQHCMALGCGFDEIRSSEVYKAYLKSAAPADAKDPVPVEVEPFSAFRALVAKVDKNVKKRAAADGKDLDTVYNLQLPSKFYALVAKVDKNVKKRAAAVDRLRP
ncbi:hypothetical protein E8E13_003569 [Curvularia kusanoi]|uniref:Uncharacterized protein n=1 Tax=Curvularia kusanoi TaxID=90978 RepID=A0A9P4WEK3_CURKU|nr:hypothetical protein E8E13_003569 [Curvularia kusanoi]